MTQKIKKLSTSTLYNLYQYGKAKALLNDEENISLLKVTLIALAAYVLYLKFFPGNFCKLY